MCDLILNLQGVWQSFIKIKTKIFQSIYKKNFYFEYYIE